MKNTVSASLLFGAFASAAILPRQSQDLDPVVLNFALTLEHLENNFYSTALQKFSQADFIAAGAPANFYKNLQYVASDEAIHVQELTSALQAAGVTPVEACTYAFPYNDAKGFLGVAALLEGVGTSAYLGAAPLITSKAYLTAAGSILVTEALHTSLLRNTIGLIPNANPNGTPIDPTTAYSLASPFFVSCPSNNPALPFKAFPTVAAPSTNFNAGQTLTLTTNATVPQGSYLTFISGLDVVSVPAQASGTGVSAAIPSQAEGQTYVVITKSDVAKTNGTLQDANVVAGVAAVQVTPPAPSGYSSSSSNSSTNVGNGNSSGTTSSSSGSGSTVSSPMSSSTVYTGAASTMTYGCFGIFALTVAALLL